MLNQLPYYIVRCLVLTLLFELSAAAVCGVRNKKDLLNVGLANVMTNPPLVVSVFLINYFFGLKARLIAVIILEISAFASEGFVYSKTLSYKKLNPWVLSLILNGFSYLSGLVINYITR